MQGRQAVGTRVDQRSTDGLPETAFQILMLQRFPVRSQSGASPTLLKLLSIAFGRFYRAPAQVVSLARSWCPLVARLRLEIWVGFPIQQMRSTRPFRIAAGRATIAEIGVPISYVSVSMPHLQAPP